MRIVVFAVRFIDGVWKECQHTCSDEEAEAVTDSSRAKAFEKFRYSAPNYADYLAGAGYVFNISLGPPDKPAEGDTLVIGVQVDDKIVRHASEINHLLARR